MNAHATKLQQPSRCRRVSALSRSCGLLAGAALLLTCSGCGGTAKAAAKPTGAAAPTKSEYVAKANAICNATNGPIAVTALELASHPGRVRAAHIIADTFIPEIKAQLRQIQAIGIPAGSQATIARMDDLLAGDLARIQRDPALAGPAAFHDFALVAHAYGLTACAPLS